MEGCKVTRRDFLGSTLLGAGAALLDGVTPARILAAALFFQRFAGPGKTCLVLENHPIFGGEAKQNEFEVDGKHLIAHQGSAIYQLQYPNSFLARFYDSIGLKTPKLTYQKWAGAQPEMPLSRTPYE